MRGCTFLVSLHLFVAAYCATLKSQIPHSKFRRKTSLGIIAGAQGEGSPFICNETQVAFIQNAIKWMKYYAESASDFLVEDDAERTAAFLGWFGYGNRELVLDMSWSIFESIRALGSEKTTYVSSLRERDVVIPIGCGTHQSSRLCRTEPRTLAFARPKDNSVVICPTAFSNEGYYGTDEGEQAAQSAWTRNRVVQPSAGLSLLHEMTHLPGVVGGFQHWKSATYDGSLDYDYAPSNCITLSDIEKLNNAQNYAFFALDITANHEHAICKIDKDAPDKEGDAIWWLKEGAGGRGETP
ncbi:hypothetical protein CORC01_08474 [Colletotrichum orchidophilum]|uniref:Lysine-specific metallo-endopeptidase domain-containing protein n=1 Tax=Colletotrichum orchidophilum TaxID=1209926 RepID=A0A1G4B4I8_9PEZI|nr:uncharacterized protein CORC01_08474 [Colletotrichum orchidophilum]OHE96256.1 hypothetical protein CORC01_08474 [Colletotrichum orchidophilum]